MNSKLRLRIKRHLDLSSRISEISTQSMNRLLEKGFKKSGWGSNHLIKVGKHKVFVKTIPLTGLEYEKSFDTKNHFELPLYYNYGVGSAGFGAFRELITHIKTTNWVLAGETRYFPLMYHYRILPSGGQSKKINPLQHRDYLKQWNNSAAIDKYIRQRAKSEYKIVIFLEHFEHTLGPWFQKNSESVDSVANQIFEAIRFLISKGIIHFDAHLYNILSDGEDFYLSDFGLALDKAFSLSPREKEFFSSHRYYDFGEVIGNIGFMLEVQYRGLSKRKKAILEKCAGILESDNWVDRQQLFLSNLDVIVGTNVFSIGKNYSHFLKKHRDMILMSNRFFFELSSNPKKNTKFEGRKLKQLLVANSIL